jgi:NET1-associated nuclear protein 1 (U3 small nucleolar RNA-associated protein 17)
VRKIRIHLSQALIDITSYFFMAISNSVKIYSMSTREIVSTLSPRTTAGSSTGHEDKITALSLDPESHFQLITASLDGTLKIWDFLEATLLKTIQVGLPITHLCLHTAHPGYAFIACNKPSKNKSKDDGKQTHFPALDALKPIHAVS